MGSEHNIDKSASLARDACDIASIGYIRRLEFRMFNKLQTKSQFVGIIVDGRLLYIYIVHGYWEYTVIHSLHV